MKTIEFKGTIDPNGQIIVPPDVARKVPAGEELQVALYWGAPSEDDEWRYAGRRRFEAAYAPEDSVYDQLIDESPTR